MGRSRRIASLAAVVATLAAWAGCAQLLDVADPTLVDAGTDGQGSTGDSMTAPDARADVDAGQTGNGDSSGGDTGSSDGRPGDASAGCFIDAEGGVEILARGQSNGYPWTGIAYVASESTLAWTAATSSMSQTFHGLGWCTLPGCTPPPPQYGSQTQMLDHLVAAGSRVYWLQVQGMASDGVYTCDPANDCATQYTQALQYSFVPPPPPDSGSQYHATLLIAADPSGSTIYFTSGTSVYSIPAGGPFPVASATFVADAGGAINDMTIAPNGRLDVATSAGVQACQPADGGACSLAAVMSMTSPGAIRVADDGAFVYAGLANFATDGLDAGPDGAVPNQVLIAVCPSSGCPQGVDMYGALMTAHGGGPTYGLAANGGTLYWAMSNHSTQRCNVSAQQVQDVIAKCDSTATTLWSQGPPYSFAFDSDSVYFRDSTGTGTVLRACKPAQ